MKKIYLTFTLFLNIAILADAQNISLIQDANPGTSGSVRGMSAQLDGNIYYIGFKAGQFGHQLFKYDTQIGSVQSITPVFNLPPNLLVASSENIYLAEGNILNRLDIETNNLNPIFDTGTVSDEFEIVTVKDETIVALSESLDGNWKVYLINESTNTNKKVNTGPIEDNIVATIGNEYIAIRPSNSFGDKEKGNFLIEKFSGNVVDPSEVLEDGPPCAPTNMFAINDYLLFDCNNGYRYLYSTTQKIYVEIPGFVKDVRENENYVFLHVGTNLYGLKKSTNVIENLGSGIQDIGEIDVIDDSLYFLNYDEGKLYSTNGSFGSLQSYNVEGEINSYSEILGVLHINDTPIIAYNEKIRDFWILKIEGDETESITGLIKMGGSTSLPFFKMENNLVFSFDHPEYGEELFSAEFESTGTDDNVALLDKVALFPNPAKEILMISTDYKVTDAKAVDIFGRSFNLDLVTENTINIGSLFPGIYSLLLTTKDSERVLLVQQFYKL